MTISVNYPRLNPRARGENHPANLESLNNLIELYEAWGKPEKAEEWRAKLPLTEAVEQ